MDPQLIVVAAALLLCPAIGGAGAIALAFKLHRQNGAQPSTGNTLAVVLLAILGAGLVMVALGVGACYGLIGVESID